MHKAAFKWFWKCGPTMEDPLFTIESVCCFLNIYFSRIADYTSTLSFRCLRDELNLCKILVIVISIIAEQEVQALSEDRKSTRLNSSHDQN